MCPSFEALEYMERLLLEVFTFQLLDLLWIRVLFILLFHFVEMIRYYVRCIVDPDDLGFELCEETATKCFSLPWKTGLECTGASRLPVNVWSMRRASIMCLGRITGRSVQPAGSMTVIE